MKSLRNRSKHVAALGLVALDVYKRQVLAMAPPSSPDGLAGAADHRSLEQAADWYVRLHADAAGSADWQQWRAWLDRSCLLYTSRCV